MEELYLPVLSHFENGNVWTGSGGAVRYKITPAGDTLTGEVWQGPLCYQLSTVEETAQFPLDEAGRTALIAWLEGHL